jgi:hypothetical protein
MVTDGTRRTVDAVNKMLTRIPDAAADVRGELRAFNDGQQIGVAQEPRLMFSAAPALLVFVRGEPLYRDIAGTGLKRI